MTIVAGIDEAGLGPLLGPLVVGCAVFSVPDELAEGDFWALLAPQVSKRAAKRDSSVAIADSKKLFKHAPGGLANLERAVLGALSVTKYNQLTLPVSTREFIERLCPTASEHLDSYRWYAGQDPQLPIDADTTDLHLRANGLKDAFARNNIDLLTLCARILNVSQYNANIARTDNKAVTLGDQSFLLLDWIWQNRPAGENVIVYIDRQGGRQKYLPALQRMYPDHNRAKILSETPDHSGYELGFGIGETLQVHYLKKGENHKLPIALASMTAKYLRELYMTMFNNWWASKYKDQYKPTAGYYTDAMRFLEESAELRRELAIDDDKLIRSR